MLLVALSGGLDSVGLVYQLLTETSEEVHGHFVFVTRHKLDPIYLCQRDALAHARAWLSQHCRPFAFTSSMLPKSSQKAPGDIVWLAHEMARLVADGTIPMPTEYMWGSRRNETARGVPSRRKTAIAVWQAVHSNVPVRCPSIEATRPELWERVPPALRELTTTCRRPKPVSGFWMACGKCHTCHETTAVGVPLERRIPVLVA